MLSQVTSIRLREAIRSGEIVSCAGRYFRPRCGDSCDCPERQSWEWAVSTVYELERKANP